MRAVTLSVLVCSVLTAASQLVFDDGKGPTKQRSPELEALSFMTGKWTSDFIVRETPDSKPVKGKGVAVVEWSPNGQFLISDEWTLLAKTKPKMWVNHVAITSWDPIKKEYRITEVQALATSTHVMTMSGKRRTIRSEEQSENHITKTTTTCERVSDSEEKIRSECSRDDGRKWVFTEGTAKRVSDGPNQAMQPTASGRTASVFDD